MPALREDVHMSSNSSSSPLEQVAAFMMSRARDVGVTETQILQLLGFKGGIGPLETLLSGRPPSETLPEIAAGIKEGTDEVLKMAKGQVESAIPLVILDELKPIIRKISMLSPDGLKHLDVYVNFLITQGMIKK
jgi:hypothetical protein